VLDSISRVGGGTVAILTPVTMTFISGKTGSLAGLARRAWR
jgi:hypothetical protein